MEPRALTLVVTPRGHLVLEAAEDGLVAETDVAVRLQLAFERGTGEGLLQLGAGEVSTPLPPAFAYWRDFGQGFVTALCARPASVGGGSAPSVPPPIQPSSTPSSRPRHR